MISNVTVNNDSESVGRRMLKKVIFIFSGEGEKSLHEMPEEIVYLKENGIEAETYSDASAKEVWSKKRSSAKKVLFLCERPDDFAYLKEKGAYVCGMMTPVSDRTLAFPGAKYIFDQVDDVEADSFIKAYQRQAGEPWEIMETQRLLVRETTVEDVDALYAIYAEPAMTRYMEGLFKDPEDEKRYAKDYIEKVYGLMGFGIWTLVNKDTGAVVGRAGFSVRNGFDEAELGFLIGVPWQGQGYAFEACSAIMKYGREVLGFERIQALVKKENTSSISLCHKLGFNVVEEVEIEEDIYGGTYQVESHVSMGPEKKGWYVRFEWKV